MENEDRIRNVMSDVENKIKQGQERLKTVAAGVDKQVRDNPWGAVAAVAVGGILLGFILGATKRNN